MDQKTKNLYLWRLKLKNKIVNCSCIIMLIIGICLVTMSTSTINSVFQINMSTLNVYYIVTLGIILIILSAVISLLNDLLQSIFKKKTAKSQNYNHKNQ